MQQVHQQAKVLAPGSKRGWVRRAGRRPREVLGAVAETLALWHFRARSRRELAQLDDRLLRDAGADRSEANKPFWRA